MIERKTWVEFKECKLLWWTNRILHTFGWAIVFEELDGKIIDVFPARVKFRGFNEESETNGFIGLTQYLKDTVNDLVLDTKE